MEPRYERILLKLSGEALMGSRGYGIDPDTVERISREVVEIKELGVEIALVVGGGNIFRGLAASENGFDRVTGDHMGMLATIMNGLALQDALESLGAFTRVMSAIEINELCESYIQRRAVRHLEKGRIVIFVAGTGNPFFTTDSAAALRAAEIGADVLIKGTRVEGVYSSDPEKDDGAEFFPRLTFTEVLRRDLRVMDITSITLARENRTPILVYNMLTPGNLLRVVRGEEVGTLVTEVMD